MSHNIFTFADAARIAGVPEHLIEREERKDEVNAARHEREAARHRGVCVSGMGPGAAPRKRSRAEIIEAARESLARQERFNASPKGRLRAALSGLSGAGYPHVASRCINAYDRGVAIGPVVHSQLSFILHELTTVGGDAGAATKFAREACAAALELAFEPFDQEAA